MTTRARSPLWRDALVAALLALALSLVVLVPIAGLFTSSWGPGDMLSTYNNVAHWNGFAYTITDHNGFPGTMDLNLFPGVDITQNSIAAALGLFTDSPFLGLNLLILLSFPITAALSVVAIRLVGLSGVWAITLALVFTFTPYHWGRALGHTYLSTTYAAVTGVILALLVGQGFLERKNRWTFWFAMAGLILITAWSGIYYAAFAVILLIASLMWRLVHGASWRAALRNGVAIAALIALTIAGLIPSLVQRVQQPLEGLGNRPPYESVELAGSLAMLLLPAPVSIAPYMGYYNEAVSAITDGAPFSEAVSLTNFGTWTITAALIFALTWAALQIRWNKTIPGTFTLTGFLTLVTIFFFIPWGLNSLVANFLTAQIRAWNRLVPTLELLIILLAAATIASSVTLMKPKVRWSAAIVLIAIVLVDQVLPYRALFKDTAERYAQDTQRASQYAIAVNGALPAGCGIVQLPHMVYPENGTEGPALNDYEHFWHSLMNPSMKWSYGAVRGTPSDDITSAMSTAAEEGDLLALQEFGTCAIHLDTRGYTQGQAQAILDRLESEVGEPVAADPAGDWVLFDIRGKGSPR